MLWIVRLEVKKTQLKVNSYKVQKKMIWKCPKPMSGLTNTSVWILGNGPTIRKVIDLVFSKLTFPKLWGRVRKFETSS